MRGGEANDGEGVDIVPSRHVNDPRPLTVLRKTSFASNATPDDLRASALETGRSDVAIIPTERVESERVDVLYEEEALLRARGEGFEKLENFRWRCRAIDALCWVRYEASLRRLRSSERKSEERAVEERAAVQRAVR